MKLTVESIIGIFLLCAIASCKENKTVDTSTDNYKKIYAMARANNDYDVMANSIYNILLADSTGTSWKDSLVKSLSDRGYYERAHILADRRINKEPNNKILLTAEGMYYRAGGKVEEARSVYKKLFVLTGEPADGYLIAMTYFAAQKFDSCDVMINKVLTETKLDGKLIDVESGYGGGTQKVPAKAALYNVKGVLARAKGDNKTALMFITQALQLFPDFVSAQQQMQALQGKN